MKSIALLAVLLIPGCSGDSEGTLESQAEHVSDCCKLEGPEIGRESSLIRLGTKTVLVHDWVAKTGSPGEMAGFSLTLAGGSTIEYTVKAGTERYVDTATTWMHPNGPDGGSSTPGISNVDFCDECDNPDGCDGGDGGDGGDGDDPPPCEDPDGCDGGGDGSGPIL